MTHDGCGDALRASSPHTHQGRACATVPDELA